MSETNGRGVDLVLNSLSEDKLQASVCCLVPQGRFLEMGKSDLTKNSTIGMIHFMNVIPLLRLKFRHVLKLFCC
jgi:fatty acid synthase